MSASPWAACYSVILLNEPLWLHGCQTGLQLLVSGLSAISLTLIIAVNYRKLFSANVQKSQIGSD